MKTIERLSVVVGCVAIVGCGTSATLSRINGGSIDAHFAGSDRDNVYVQTSSSDVQAIPKSEVSDIDHPGDGAAVVGGLVLGYGILNIGVGAPRCDTEGGAFCVGVFTPAVIGASMLLWGLITHANSVSDLQRPAQWTAPNPTPLPPFRPTAPPPISYPPATSPAVPATQPSALGGLHHDYRRAA